MLHLVSFLSFTFIRRRTLTMAKYKIRTHNRVDVDGNADSAKSYQDILDQESTPNIAIPKDENNRHYQEYLEWVAAGNTPD